MLWRIVYLNIQGDIFNPVDLRTWEWMFRWRICQNNVQKISKRSSHPAMTWRLNQPPYLTLVSFTAVANRSALSHEESLRLWARLQQPEGPFLPNFGWGAPPSSSAHFEVRRARQRSQVWLFVWTDAQSLFRWTHLLIKACASYHIVCLALSEPKV